MVVWSSVVLNRTVHWHHWCFDNLSSSHLQSQSELYHISWWYLRWLNTVFRAVSGTSRDGVCVKLEKQTWRRKSNVHRRQFLKICWLKFCDIWQNFYLYRTFNNENFKMEVEQTNFVTHLIITVQSYYCLSKNPSVKIWWNMFQMVMINCSKLCASL